ncbi:hypothetical protein M5689_025202 [Euphorbia peplus]|nr:hypothetical protein M5689_025202 [Euphorbia peplus]
MAASGFAGYSIAEAYTVRKMYKEKMKNELSKMESAEKKSESESYDQNLTNKKSNSGCWVFKKRRGSSQVSSTAFQEMQLQESEK